MANAHVRISSTGMYVPDRVVTNEDIAGIVRNYDPSISGKPLDEWIALRYGIKERRWSDEMPSEQAAHAARQAIEKAGLQVENIDFLVLNTSFGDYSQPTTATQVQKHLGMRPDTFAMEINSPCAGIIFGIVTAWQFLMSGRYKHALVVGVDKMTSLVDKTDFRTCGLFGEGAGACIVELSDKPGLLDYHLGSMGEAGGPGDISLGILSGNARFPTSHETVDKGMHYLKMEGRKVEEFVKFSYKDLVERLVFQKDMTISEIDCVVPHQASRFLVERSLVDLGFSSDRICFTLEKYGNTSAASILITLHDFLRKQPDFNGTILLLGMGSGLNWGGLLLRVPE